MKTKFQIETDKKLVYKLINDKIIENNNEYCLSWWLNPRNSDCGLKTTEINQRAKSLVKEGFLSIDEKMTSTSTGTCYRLTEKVPTWFDKTLNQIKTSHL